MSKVFIFNTGPTEIHVNVNDAPPYRVTTVPQADISTWVPGTPAANNLPDFTGSQVGIPGQFRVGSNDVAITLTSGNKTVPVTITIPASVHSRDTLQLYFSWDGVGHVYWMLLQRGLPVAGNTSILTEPVPPAPESTPEPEPTQTPAPELSGRVFLEKLRDALIQELRAR